MLTLDELNEFKNKSGGITANGLPFLKTSILLAVPFSDMRKSRTVQYILSNIRKMPYMENTELKDLLIYFKVSYTFNNNFYEDTSQEPAIFIDGGDKISYWYQVFQLSAVTGFNCKLEDVSISYECSSISIIEEKFKSSTISIPSINIRTDLSSDIYEF